MASIILSQQQRFGLRIVGGIVFILASKWVFWDTKPATPYGQIAHPAILERITLGSPLSGQPLDTRKYGFLQSRINRDETPDLFDNDIRNGINDFWERFQKPFTTSSETYHLDEQVVRGAVDELLGFNGWAAAACSSLTRPFGGQTREDDYSDLASPGALYYFALVVHGADHFLIDQLAVIVQLSKRLGANSIFVSLVDYASIDSTPFICDIAEAVMILLGISFRIRQVPPMTSDPTASYYPLEEAYTRNLALEPLNELWERRKVKFHRVIWLKGFTCPNDILETIRVSQVNDAAMVCSMDWKEHNGFFIYNDRWRTRDMDGNLFRGSKSTSPIDEAPPRDAYGGARYTLHLPFQVFCCESGTHIVDPHKSYYHGVSYQSSVAGVFNTSATADHKAPQWYEGPCMDSSQLHFCRDMWMVAFREGIREEAKRIQHDERLGKQRQVHPFMEELIQAMVASYAPATGNRIGYANSGNYLADETGASPGGGPGMDNDHSKNAGAAGGADQAPEGEEEEEEEEEEGDEEAGADGVDGQAGAPGAVREEYDENEGGVGRPIDLAVKIEDERKVRPGAAAGGAGGAQIPDNAAADAKLPPVKVQIEAQQEQADKRLAAKQADAGRAEAVRAAAKDMAKGVPGGGAGAVVGAAAGAGGAEAADKAAEAAAAGVEKPVEWVRVEQQDAPQKRNVKVKRSWFSFGGGQDENVEPTAHESSLLPAAVDAEHAKRSLEKRRPRSLPNQDFDYAVARIMVNPRCVTTYAGVSHTQLALDLFGTGEDEKAERAQKDKYTLDEWRTPPESFVCQEMRTTGGRTAPKQQRRTGFQMARLLLNGWRPTSRANE